MQIYAISDLHGYYPYIPECDLLLLGGDYTPGGTLEQQHRFFDLEFREWLRTLIPKCRYVVGIAGNHDLILEEEPKLAKSLPWIYLKDSAVELEGIKIWGSPYTPQYGNWAFMREDNALGHVFMQIPNNLDILLVHGPAYSILDKNRDGILCGSKTLYGEIKRANPKAVVHGHIHESRGTESIGDTTFYNVAYLDGGNYPKYNCMNIALE